jgi:hypothetical protein
MLIRYGLWYMGIMAVQDYATYGFFKDFASPIVTFFAATVAGVITFTFARIQARIATSQRDIALDKLKNDLFQRRYDIYAATKELLELIPMIHSIRDSQPGKIRSLYVKMDEARFYFPPDIIKLLDGIHKACEDFLIHLGERENTSDESEKWRELGELLAYDQQVLRSFYSYLPGCFETTLAFSQLTR